MHKLRTLAILALTLGPFTGCTARAALPSGATRVPTDDSLVPFESLGILCMGSSTVPPPPPAGVLEGDPSDPVWPVWLQAQDGSRRYVVWPRGFSVRFDPNATLLDETGTPILHAGSPLTFESVASDPSTWTRTRPYVADAFETGLAEVAHCYTRDH